MNTITPIRFLQANGKILASDRSHHYALRTKPRLKQVAEVSSLVFALTCLLGQVTEHLAAHRIDGLAVPSPKLRGGHVGVRVE